MLDFTHDGYENLFRTALEQGTSLFCGAGFSVESFDGNGNRLPTGAELLERLQATFPIVQTYKTLSRACTRIINTDKQSFYSRLKEWFSVENFDPAYLSLLQIKLKKIYTTNIDDLFFKIFERNNHLTYLNDCSIKGNSYEDDSAVLYFPLHGCVRNEQNYVFGATEIASAFSQRGNEKSWRSLATDAAKHAILFWGWNFEDPGPIAAMYGNGNNIDDNVNRWVLLRDPDGETFDYIRSLRFNVIIGDTISMLKYLSEFVNHWPNNIVSQQEVVENINLRTYEIPLNDQFLPSYPLRKFFLEYSPRWSHIYSGVIHKTVYYKRIAESISSGSNTVVIGIRGAGKTTLFMQLLADYSSLKTILVHKLVAPSQEQSQLYIKRLNGQKSLLFVDDCFRDTNAVIELFRAKNIQVVCFDRDFNYERQYHKIKNYSFDLIDVTEITKEDAQSILNTIPVAIRKQNAGTKNFQKDPTILNLLAANLRAADFNFMDSFYKKDAIAAKVFLMIVYVHYCGTPCSFDMVYSFLGDDRYTWNDMFDILKRSGGLLLEVSEQFRQNDIMANLQDYYQCRSRFLAEKIISSIPVGEKFFAEVISEFTRYVPAYKICSYDKFKRSAYDADIAVRAFPNIEDGTTFYELCSEKDDSEYIYQQAAIYFSRKHDYKSAFDWIERARNLANYNRFSIDSTYAKIYFDVNLPANQGEAESALETLSKCCENDQRKSIHFAVFARCCLAFYEKYSENRYISLALSYITEGLDDRNLSLSKENKKELSRLKTKLELCL